MYEPDFGIKHIRTILGKAETKKGICYRDVESIVPLHSPKSIISSLVEKGYLKASRVEKENGQDVQYFTASEEGIDYLYGLENLEFTRAAMNELH